MPVVNMIIDGNCSRLYLKVNRGREKPHCKIMEIVIPLEYVFSLASTFKNPLHESVTLDMTSAKEYRNFCDVDIYQSGHERWPWRQLPLNKAKIMLKIRTQWSKLVSLLSQLINNLYKNTDCILKIQQKTRRLLDLQCLSQIKTGRSK